MIEYNNSQYKTIAISRKENKFCLKVRSQCTLHTNRYYKLVGIQGGMHPASFSIEGGSQ